MSSKYSLAATLVAKRVLAAFASDPPRNNASWMPVDKISKPG
jgi:hypothetical protein